MVALQRSYLGQRLYRTVTGRGFSTNPTSLGRWRWPIFSVVALIAFSVTVVPLMVLLMGTFMRAFGYFNIPRPWTIENWQRVLADPSLIKSLWNTLVVGLGTAVSGAAIYALIAYVVVRRQFKGRALLDFISAARDISTVVLLGSSQSRTMALLALDYAFGGQFERGAVVAFLTSLVVIVIALIAHVVGSRVGIGGQH